MTRRREEVEFGPEPARHIESKPPTRSSAPPVRIDSARNIHGLSPTAIAPLPMHAPRSSIFARALLYLAVVAASAGVPHASSMSPAPQSRVRQAIEALDHKSPAERVEAAQRLGKFGRRASKAIGPLVEHLLDPEPEVRDACGAALAKIGGKASGALLDALRNALSTGKEFPLRSFVECGIQLKGGQEGIVDALRSTSPYPGAASDLIGLPDVFLLATLAHPTLTGEALTALLGSAPVEFDEPGKALLAELELGPDTLKAVELCASGQPTGEGLLDARTWLAAPRPELLGVACWLIGSSADPKTSLADLRLLEPLLDAEDHGVRRSAFWAFEKRAHLDHASELGDWLRKPTPVRATEFPEPRMTIDLDDTLVDLLSASLRISQPHSNWDREDQLLAAIAELLSLGDKYEQSSGDSGPRMDWPQVWRAAASWAGPLDVPIGDSHQGRASASSPSPKKAVPSGAIPAPTPLALVVEKGLGRALGSGDEALRDACIKALQTRPRTTRKTHDLLLEAFISPDDSLSREASWALAGSSDPLMAIEVLAEVTAHPQRGTTAETLIAGFHHPAAVQLLLRETLEMPRNIVPWVWLEMAAVPETRSKFVRRSEELVAQGHVSLIPLIVRLEGDPLEFLEVSAGSDSRHVRMVAAHCIAQFRDTWARDLLEGMEPKNDAETEFVQELLAGMK